MTAQELKERLRETRENMNKCHATRLHRAVSWLIGAERYKDDHDVAFITKWISFNSCYSVLNEAEQLSERRSFQRFVEQVVALDTEQRIYNSLWLNFSSFVRGLLNNQYVFSPYWDSINNNDENWKESFQRSESVVHSALANQDVALLLSVVMDRLYVLRNQLMHGGATYQSGVNRDQVRDGANLLGELLPIIITIMMEYPEVEWGEIYYPVVDA